MPDYRVVSEVDPGPDQREHRGSSLGLDEARLVTLMQAGSLAEAAVDARDTEPHRERRIISIEELHPGVAYRDEEILERLTKVDPELGEPAIDITRFDAIQGPVYYHPDFAELVEHMADGLRESNLVPGLSASILKSNDYAMVEIYDQAVQRYLSVGADLKHLIWDRRAAGRAGALSIARALIHASNALH